MQIICINLHTLALMLSITILWVKGQNRIFFLWENREECSDSWTQQYIEVWDVTLPLSREKGIFRDRNDAMSLQMDFIS